MGTLPLPADPNALLASITLKVKKQQRIALLSSIIVVIPSVSGTINGTGAVSG
jgi:hypothetical protein